MSKYTIGMNLESPNVKGIYGGHIDLKNDSIRFLAILAQQGCIECPALTLCPGPFHAAKKFEENSLQPIDVAAKEAKSTLSFYHNRTMKSVVEAGVEALIVKNAADAQIAEDNAQGLQELRDYDRQ